MLRTLVLIAGLGLIPKVTAPLPAPVEFTTSDGIRIYGDVYRTKAPSAPVILVFHQAGSSRGAIDQRSGGAMYEPPNETVRHAGESAPYVDVLNDMEAAVTYARRRFPSAPLYAWGSSYSAGLVFLLAARHPRDIAAVLAFSPGEYFGGKHAVRNAARHVDVPVFIDSAAEPAEIQSARSIYGAVAARRKKQFVPQRGIHGASTLRDDRDPDGAAENWDAVSAFLGTLPTPP